MQSDVLAFVARVQSDPALQRIAKKIKLVFPLYNEEVHLLARKGIASFDDLANRRVAIGREGSGTYLTVRLLFKLSEVVPREMVPIDTDEALAELKAGRIDAMFFVAGYPVKLLAEDVTAANDFVLVPITNKGIAKFYPRVVIPANTYAWQLQPVDTVLAGSIAGLGALSLFAPRPSAPPPLAHPAPPLPVAEAPVSAPPTSSARAVETPRRLRSGRPRRPWCRQRRRGRDRRRHPHPGRSAGSRCGCPRARRVPRTSVRLRRTTREVTIRAPSSTGC